jgi:hypothetical protein
MTAPEPLPLAQSIRASRTVRALEADDTDLDGRRRFEEGALPGARAG